jgi:dephospho-CoA kinase
MAKFKIAVTGGIGSGKSLATTIFKEYGIKTISCDDISRDIYKDQSVKDKIVQSFGQQVLTKGGKVSRKALADVVFSDKDKLKTLNGITHPAIIDKMHDFIGQDLDIVVAEVPLLFECGLQDDFDMVIVLKRPLKDRVKSVCIRSGMTEEEVFTRIKNQFDYESLKNNAYTIINNDGDADSLRQKIRCIISEIESKLQK